MREKDVRKTIYTKIDELPTLPTALPRLLGLIASAKTDAAEVAEVVSEDPALAAKLLKVANSAYYGFQREITSLDMAVPLLGFNMVRSLALSIGIMQGLPSVEGEKSGFSARRLWTHSVAVATLMEKIGRRLGKDGTRPYHFVLGLLHDIGKVVLDQFFRSSFEEAIRESLSESHVPLYLAERRIIGLDHGQIGGLLFTRWNLPDTITMPITWHHERENAEADRNLDVVMLRIADALTYRMKWAGEAQAGHEGIRREDLEILGLEEEDVNRAVEQVMGQRESIVSFSEALV